jgi:acetyl-CoA acetyltransferase
MAAIIGAHALPVGSLMPGEGATGGVFEAERLTPVVLSALESAGVTTADVDSAIFSANPPSTPQIGFSAYMAARLGLNCSGQLSEVLNMGISGGLAFDQAIADVDIGRADIAIAAGVLYQATIKGHVGMEQGIRAVGDVDWQAPFGFTPISWYALDAARYLYETNSTESDLAQIAVKSRRWSSLNPLSQLPELITEADVLASQYIVDPLRLYDIPKRADGAICLVVASDAVAIEMGKNKVGVKSRGFYHDGLHQMDDEPHDMTDFPAARQAVNNALQQAGLELSDIDLLELYAPCSITEILVAESIGLFERGHTAAATREGRTSPGGDVMLNTSGGCLGRGHPPALTGMYGIYELWEQFSGKAAGRQVDDADFGLHVCELGNYNAALAHVLEKRV